jgi:dolichol-phosphate mannosyltransferase
MVNPIKFMVKKKISVILPTYNEVENVLEVTQRISKILGDDLFEIIIVDDNSPDQTWKIVKEMKNPSYKLIRRFDKKGLASALGDGIKRAKGDIIVWLDCDLGIPPEEIPNLINAIESNADIAIGSRYVSGGKDLRPKIRTITSRLINNLAQILLGRYVKDYTSGFAAVKKEVFKKVKFPGAGFGEYFIEFIFDSGRKGFKIAEVGYVYTDRLRGESKSGANIRVLIRYGFQYTFRILQLFFKRIRRID